MTTLMTAAAHALPALAAPGGWLLARELGLFDLQALGYPLAHEVLDVAARVDLVDRQPLPHPFDVTCSGVCVCAGKS